MSGGVGRAPRSRCGKSCGRVGLEVVRGDLGGSGGGLPSGPSRDLAPEK